MSTIDWSVVPATEDEARALGCTCTWWGGSILHFEDDCPITDRHFKGQVVPALYGENGPDSPDAT